MRERIKESIAFAESVKEPQLAGTGDRTVRMPWAGGKTIRRQNYVLEITIPKVYFHLSIVYAILSHNGVNVGKMAFLGRIAWVEA